MADPRELKTLSETAENLLAEGRWPEAADIYSRLGIMFPDHPDIHHVHGLVLMEQRYWDKALQQIDRAIALNPRSAAYHRSRGDTLYGAGKLQQAIEAFTKALSIKPLDTDAMINLGNALYASSRSSEALYWYRKAAELDPANLMALNNTGKTLLDQGLMDQALQWFDKALAMDPDYAEARFNRSVLFLAQGDYARGWKEYEWRFRRKSALQVYPRRFQTDRWNGSPYAGKRLLVHCEQGMGDVIQFCRYLPQVKSLGGTLIAEVHAPLVPLLETMSAVDQVIPFSALQDPAVAFDLVAPLLSLPGILGSDLNNLPNQVPYLQTDPRKAAFWREQEDQVHGLRIGLVWSGSAVDPRRACPTELLEILFSIQGAHFFSLQKGLTEPARTVLHRYANVTHWGDQLRDFSDTAAVVAGLDLVISVDTATAHLAGALGKPLWILLPAVADWRWLLNRTDSPWYPTARLFRQRQAGDWHILMEQVSRQLRQMIAIHGTFERGRVYHAQDRLDDAIRAYGQALDMAPDTEPALRNLGLAYFQKGDPRKAAQCYERCLEMNPGAVDVLTNLGAAYQRLHQPSRAESCYTKALDIDPGYVPAIYNQGNIRLDQGKLDSAAALYQRALAINPAHVSSICNLGRTLHRLGHLDQALDMYNQALAIAPAHPETRFNRSVTLLLQGKWSQGWPEYEWRFQCHNRRQIYPHSLSGQRWQGEPLGSKTLLVHGEQGLGDALQFVRFLPWINKQNGRILLETHKPLLPLLKGVPGIDALLELSADSPPAHPYDIYIPLCSLPGLFSTTPDNLPYIGPYLSACQEKMIPWRARLPQKGFNIGLVWSGSDTYPERSCRLQNLASLAQVAGVNWIGLQKGPGADQINDPQLPSQWITANWGPEFDDFSHTAAAIACLDLIITIDTSVAHLAGALGKPTWLLLPKVPDWRWLTQRPDTPWYPCMRLFRQVQSGDWRSVAQQVGLMLKNARLV